MNKGFWWRYLREGDHLKNLDIDVRIILKCIFNRWDWEAWAGLLWLRTRTFGARL